MSNNIKPDFNKVRRNIANINTGPSTLDMLGQAAQVYGTIKQNERQDLKGSLDILTNALSTLNYAQTDENLSYDDLEKIDGIKADWQGNVNLYEYNKQLVINALDDFTEKSRSWKHSEDKEVSKLVIADAKRKLAYQDTQKDLREDSLNKLESLASQYINLTKNDPSFTNKLDISEANKLMEDIGKTYNSLNEKFAKNIPAKHADLYTDMVELNELTQRTLEADLNTNLKGIQIKIDETSPYLIDFLEKRGLRQTGVEGEIATYDLDVGIDMDDSAPYTNTRDAFMFSQDLSSSELKPDDSLYKDALQSFGQYEEALKAIESKDIKLKHRAPELAVFDLVENWVADPTKRNMALMVGQAVWSDVDITKKDEKGNELPFYKALSEEDRKALNTVITQLKDRKNSGQFVAEGDKLQSLINAELKSALRGGQQDAIQMSEGLASDIHRSNRDLNDKIIQLNAKYPAAEGKDIPKLPVIAGDANLQTIDQNKEQHVNIMQSMLDKEQKGEWWWMDTAISADPTGILKELMSDRDAPMESKDKTMKLLIDEFLHIDGSPDRYNDVSDMFDANPYHIEAFYGILKSYRYLNLASPTLSLEEQIGATGQ